MDGSEFRCRFNRPGACVLATERYVGELEELRAKEASTWELLQALLLEAQENGLPEAQNAETNPSSRKCTYRAPVGERAMKKLRKWGDPPWVGELRLDSATSFNGSKSFWRAYFHDLVERSTGVFSDDVLMSSVVAKGATQTSKKFRRGFNVNQQDGHIVKAVDSARNWISRNGQYELRRLHQ
ncbi:hypothetical protein KBX10_04625 [Corynebacterium sp. CCUG 59401]|nr:hypothetical protein [Corynebacterium pseudogenitalium]